MAEKELAKGYDPALVEERWRVRWETEKTFTPDPDGPGEPFSLVIPPPNVTGNLHIGHALNLTLQDILCRHSRQKGKKVLWVPGIDHAGISTQNVVERALAKEGKSRADLGREKFLERVWEWKAQYGDNILRQIRAMGASVDWTRLRFTMDEGLSRAVRKVFVRLYEEGLIYRGEYIVNWCVRCHTALADDEVEHEPRSGTLWHVRYPLADGSGDIVIATTRPETMLGDTAVAVHPDDERHRHLAGKMVRLPLSDREIPVIADKYVDREFGTGALKVTPSHDVNDWRLGFKHKLEFRQVIDDAGRMNENAGPYAGLSREEARKRIVEDLEAGGFLVGVQKHEHSVGTCYRCHSVVEPCVSTQWFVATTKMAPQARAAVPAEVRIVPESWTKTYYNWLDNIRDWCISRQIWWGHRIPAWTCDACGELVVAVDEPRTCPKCGATALTQDPDVLDTWFSSALWPFSTLGWPDETKELETFYPVSVLVTAFDILFFWVARMIMMGQHFMGRAPFHDVYIHALVRDEQGKKMSKSSGNGIDPLKMIDEYGTDALRFTLCAFAAMGRDIRLSEKRIAGYRRFVNKLWNAARFSLMNLPDGDVAMADLDNIGGCFADRAEALHHQWILTRLEKLKTGVDESLAAYRFNDAAQQLYHFLWSEFCDWYLELVKPDMQAGGARRMVAQCVLLTVLRELLVLMHPVMPFVTAEIWTALPAWSAEAGIAYSDDLALVPYPAPHPGRIDEAAARDMELVMEVTASIRTVRAELGISPAAEIAAIIHPATDADGRILRANAERIRTLARLASLIIDSGAAAPRVSANAVARGNEIFVPLEGLVDFAAEVARADKELARLDKERKGLEAKLANENFVAHAPEDVVEAARSRAEEIADAMRKLDEMKQRFQAFS